MAHYGILLSSASETAGPLVTGNCLTSAMATARAELICRAQPGVEFEVVSRGSSQVPWRSVTGETPREVLDRRWA